MERRSVVAVATKMMEALPTKAVAERPCAILWLVHCAPATGSLYHLLVLIAQCRATFKLHYPNNKLWTFATCTMIELYPADFIKSGNDLTHLCKEQSKPALIILNQPIADTRVLGRLWNHSSYRLCADGGANQLYDLFVQNDPSQLDQYVRRFATFPSGF